MKQAIVGTASTLAAALTLTGGIVLGTGLPASAQTVPLEEQGTLVPAEDEYRFEAEAGQVLAIVMNSETFDTVLTLLGPDGEEVAFNDDYGGTLNSRIIYSVPEAGTYTVLARSYAGNGGDYNLEVRPASAYEMAYNEAQMMVEAGDYEAAIAAYSEAIELDASNPQAYLGRADAYFGQAYAQSEAQGEPFEGPQDLTPEARDAIVSDFETAADLYEATGDAYAADSLREQAEFIRSGDGLAPGGTR